MLKILEDKGNKLKHFSLVKYALLKPVFLVNQSSNFKTATYFTVEQ